ncbi:glycoside hydrolase family 76 [Emericellopsis cladophorae]|uniref:Mannan endo-1,6-alpha-mannosidase n=1 Tax=Emericellopsis cladophorae TaxID=2686198 RepID=A0A9P9Y0E8_9HYPO|nr:glycoside hydrolase family 76 [Emericellopsis cladophorae]KAI6781196.1 glycoside hydrolase family 76 [Emericellopsis cladophorae]
MRGLHNMPLCAAILLSHSLFGVAAADLAIDSRDDMVETAGILAEDVMSYYDGDKAGHIPGVLGQREIHFYQSGIFMGTFVNYFHLTGDETYNDLVQQGVLFQVGPDENFSPYNQTTRLGNDDQCYWALTAMAAAEYEFPDPPKGEPQWLDLAKTVYSDQVDRLDNKCGGGLRWQIINLNVGYNYKNVISSGCLANLAARLALHTGDDKYVDTVEELWDWLSESDLIDADSGAVYDGIVISNDDCDADALQVSHNAAILTYTAAVMYNHTDGSDTWRQRLEKLSGSLLDTFFDDGVAIEAQCEPYLLCTLDMPTSKGLMLRWLASTARLAPFLADKIQSKLKTTAQAAIDHCEGDKSERECSVYWSNDSFIKPEESGLLEKLAVLSSVQGLLALSDDVTAKNSADKDETSDNSSDEDESTPPKPGSPEEPDEPDAAHKQVSVAHLLLLGCAALALV